MSRMNVKKTPPQPGTVPAPSLAQVHILLTNLVLAQASREPWLARALVTLMLTLHQCLLIMVVVMGKP